MKQHLIAKSLSATDSIFLATGLAGAFVPFRLRKEKKNAVQIVTLAIIVKELFIGKITHTFKLPLLSMPLQSFRQGITNVDLATFLYNA